MRCLNDRLRERFAVEGPSGSPKVPTYREGYGAGDYDASYSLPLSPQIGAHFFHLSDHVPKRAALNQL